MSLWMQKNKQQLYDLVKDIKTKKEFENEIKNKSKEFDDLIDENIVALLIVDELGRNTQAFSKISNLQPGSEGTIIGKISNIYKTREFNRKNGAKGKVINLEIEDETGKCGLVLWDRDVEIVKDRKIKIGTNVKVINGYIKDGFNGLEINIGRWGFIEVEPNEKVEIDKIEMKEDKIKTKGKIIRIEPTRAFFKDDGEFGFVTNIDLEADGKHTKITVWDEKVKDIQKYKIGDQIEIKNIDIKQKNGKEELHINSKGTIKKL
jgi:replication factor A1